MRNFHGQFGRSMSAAAAILDDYALLLEATQGGQGFASPQDARSFYERDAIGIVQPVELMTFY
jgi:hypothetical protein